MLTVFLSIKSYCLKCRIYVLLLEGISTLNDSETIFYNLHISHKLFKLEI